MKSRSQLDILNDPGFAQELARQKLTAPVPYGGGLRARLDLQVAPARRLGIEVEFVSANRRGKSVRALLVHDPSMPPGARKWVHVVPWGTAFQEALVDAGLISARGRQPLDQRMADIMGPPPE